jgi:hypothetical protein
MHMTVRGGKSLMRLGYDQGGGGYQGMEVNADPRRTNVTGGGGEQAAQQQSGWEQEYAQLFALIEDIPGALELLDRLLMSDPSMHNAMTGQTGGTGRPSAPEAEDRGKARARDAEFAPMSRAMAVDWRPLIKGPHSTQAIRGFVAQSEMKRRMREEEEFYKRFPTASRLRRAF